MQHNEAMADRYLSGFDSQEYPPAYNGTAVTRSNSMASSGKVEEEMELEETKRSEWPNAHALTTQGQQAVFATAHGRDEDGSPQRVHEIV